MEPIVIARAPGHLSLGWDDVALGVASGPDEGIMISAAINTYAYTIVSPCDADDVRITVAACNGSPWHISDGSPWGADLALPKAILKLFGTRRGLDIFLSTQAPLGIGLGLSGSLAVSMVKALAFTCGLDLDPHEVAELACRVLTEAVSLHDDTACQYAAACGGMSSIGVSHGKVRVDPLRMTAESRQSFGRHLMLFDWLSPRHPGRDTALCAGAPDVSERSVSSPSDGSPGARRRVRTAVEQGEWETLGELLQWRWLERRRMAAASQDDVYVQSLAAARDSGAFGGQGTAVSGGYLCLLCPEERQADVTKAMNARGLQRLGLALEPDGVEVMEAVPRAKLRSIATSWEPAQLGSYLLQPR